MSENLYILIATVDERISNLPNVLVSEQSGVFYVITHQVTSLLSKNILKTIRELRERKDVIYLLLDDIRGVGKNRNHSLAYVKDGIALICDDDIIFCDNFIENVKHSFVSNPTTDVITFKTLSLSGEDYRVYPDDMVKHTQKTITGVGSIEIAFKIDVIKKNGIRFDDEFGPGSFDYPIGEDYIFMSDVLKKGLKAIFMPIGIVKHPELSTGLRFDEKTIYGRGAVFARVFGFKSLVIDVWYSFRKYSLYKHELNFFSYLYHMLNGSIHYLKSNHND